MQKDCLIALDVGSVAGRSAVFDVEGRLLGVAMEEWTPRVPDDEPLGSEFDPHEVWAALCRTTRLALEQAGLSPQTVRGLSATSQRDGVVFLDACGHEIYCGTNRDIRGALYAEDIARQFGSLIYQVTGRWPLGLDALARLWWFRLQRPDVFQRLAHLCMISDWLIFRLSGRFCSEPTNASSSMLFDVVECAWSPELAALVGFSMEICPPCCPPGTAVGALTAPAAEALGLPAGIPVVTGAGDSQAACLGCNAFEDGATTVIAGTTMPLQMVLAQPVLDDSHRPHLGAHVVPGRWVLESNAGLAGAAYRWFCEAFVGKGVPAYHKLEREARASRPGEAMAVLGPQIADFHELTFPPKSTFAFPYLGGVERLPTRGSLARAILENIAYAVRGNLEQLAAVGGQQPDTLNLCGGLSRSPLFTQIVADVCQRRVQVPTVRETSSLGAVICAAVGARLYPDLLSAAQAMAHWEPIVEPQPATARIYKGLYRQWTRLFEQARRL